MVASMTAYARQQLEQDWGTLSWEIRAVNHRYLEPGIRMPDRLRALEPKVRDTLRRHIGRGKVDCQLRFESSAEYRSEQAGVDRELALKVAALGETINDLSPSSAPLAVIDILNWPGVLREPEQDMSAIEEQALALLERTLAALNDSRRREGAALAEMIEQRLSAIDRIVDELRQCLPAILERQREMLTERLRELKTELDPERLEQEMALLAQKADVDEELDRLATHVREVRRVLTLDEPIGRRLDFLMQELNREANTLSSKSIVAETSHSAVELKVLIEQMREQVQNIE